MDFLSKLFSGQSVNTISADEAQKKLTQKPKPYLLDVRQPEEYRAGHIAGAKLIPLGELRSRINELPKDQEIIVVCQSGSRSFSATRQLTSADYNAVNLNGGVSAWLRAGFPIIQGKEQS
jgi:rhodanese-related sulfurtransferase